MPLYTCAASDSAFLLRQIDIGFVGGLTNAGNVLFRYDAGEGLHCQCKGVGIVGFVFANMMYKLISC